MGITILELVSWFTGKVDNSFLNTFTIQCIQPGMDVQPGRYTGVSYNYQVSISEDEEEEEEVREVINNKGNGHGQVKL